MILMECRSLGALPRRDLVASAPPNALRFCCQALLRPPPNLARRTYPAAAETV